MKRKIKLEAIDEYRTVTINVTVEFTGIFTRGEQENRRKRLSNELYAAMQRSGFDCEEIEFYK